MPTRTLENFQAGAGDASAILSQSGRQAQGVAENVPISNFNVRLMELLQKYQQLGTKPFAEQSFGAQEAQAQRVFQGPGNLAGASPTLQSQVRGADVSAIQPTISSAQQSQKTFGEQISGFGDAISRAQGLVEGFEKQRQNQKTEAQNIINFALTSGGSAGLEALLKSQPGIVKLSGFDEATIQGLIPTFRKKEEDADKLKKQVQFQDLGDRIGVFDNAGNLIRYEKKGATPKTGGVGTEDKLGNLSPSLQATVRTIIGQFDNEQTVKNYQTSAEAIDALKTAGSSPTDDIQRIYAFAKVMDPNSVVREGEYKTIQDYSTALLERVGLKARRIFDNSGFLTQEARGFMLRTLQNRLSSSERAQKNIYNEYARRINKITGGTDCAEYLTDYSKPFVTQKQELPQQMVKNNVIYQLGADNKYYPVGSSR